MLTFHAIGDWSPDRVHHLTSESTRRIVPQVQSAIEAAWQKTFAKPGLLLFDGPMLRLESWQATPDQLTLTLSRTTYKEFLGTNLLNPHLADQFGGEILANPVGVSPALETSDGYLMFGRRNATVAYYPDRIHPFAGALEPKDSADVFAAVRRELHEELGLGDSDIGDLRCTGIAEDQSIRQPELIFRATVSRTRRQIQESVDRKEHHGSWSVHADRHAIEEALGDASELTPVAVASLLLWGQVKFGHPWFSGRPEGGSSSHVSRKT
jgi:8-oxo-dGTP pyrophosphatase MutT (NUDIX family)